MAAQETAHTYELLTRVIFSDLERAIHDMASQYLHRSTQENARRIEQIMHQRKSTNPLIMDLLILNKDGDILVWTGEQATPVVRNREYFRHHVENPLSKTYVTPPQLSLVKHSKWFFSLSRAIRDEQGKLLGIGVAIIDIGALENDFSGLLDSTQQSVALLHQDGMLIFRSPRVAPSAAENIIRITNITTPLQQTHTQLIPAGLDGQRRIISLRPLQDYNLIVSGSAHFDSALGVWSKASLFSLTLWVLVAIAGLVGTLWLHRMQQQEQKTQATYRRLFDSVSDAIFLVEVNSNGDSFRYHDCNPAYAHQTGIPSASLAGLTPQELLPADIATAVHARYLSCMTQRRVIEYEEELQLPAGRRIWHTTLNPVVDTHGKVTLILGICRDITLQMEFTQKLKNITQNLPGFVYQMQRDPDGTLHFPYASEGVFRLFGVTPEQVYADANSLLGLIHADDAEWVMQESMQAAEQLQSWRATFRMRHPSGRIMWIEARDTSQRMDDGSILWTGYVNDITEHKALEDALRASESTFRTPAENVNNIGAQSADD